MIHNDMTPSDLLTLIQQASPGFGDQTPSARVISIDLETWGKKPGCAIRSIGASVVDTRTGKAELHTFYRNISEESCIEAGLTHDPDTVLWWSRQGADAKAAFERQPHAPLKAALADFAQWYSEGCDLYAETLSVWGNGKEFDISILEHCYFSVRQPVPWDFWNSCDVRTIIWLGAQLGINFKVCSEFAGVPHYALDDAIHQGIYTAKTIAVIRKVWERGLKALQDDHEAAAPVVDGRYLIGVDEVYVGRDGDDVVVGRPTTSDAPGDRRLVLELLDEDGDVSDKQATVDIGHPSFRPATSDEIKAWCGAVRKAARQLEAYEIAMSAAVDALNVLGATDTAASLAELHKKIKGVTQ